MQIRGQVVKLMYYVHLNAILGRVCPKTSKPYPIVLLVKPVGTLTQTLVRGRVELDADLVLAAAEDLVDVAVVVVLARVQLV